MLLESLNIPLTFFLSVTPDNKYPEHQTLIQILYLNPRPKSIQGSIINKNLV